MTEENQRLRGKLQSIEQIVTSALASQPHGDEECGEHLRRALSDIGKEVGGELFGNAAAMREALLNLRDGELAFCEKNVKCGVGLSSIGLEHHCRIIRDVIGRAISAPERNCGRFKTWKEAWEHFYDEKCEEPHKIYDGGVSAAFLEWLFAPMAEKGDGDEND